MGRFDDENDRSYTYDSDDDFSLRNIGRGFEKLSGSKAEDALTELEKRELEKRAVEVSSSCKENDPDDPFRTEGKTGIKPMFHALGLVLGTVVLVGTAKLTGSLIIAFLLCAAVILACNKAGDKLSENGEISPGELITDLLKDLFSSRTLLTFIIMILLVVFDTFLRR